MRAFLLTTVLLLPLLHCPSAFGACTPGTNWTASWTDSFNQTTYSLTAPCKVYIDTPFAITATVTDNTYTDSWVGAGWSITDSVTGVEASGFSIDTVAGEWVYSFQQTYTGAPLDHTITFSCTDLGEGSSAHNWAGQSIGDLTVDPYPPSYYPVKTTLEGLKEDYDLSPADAYEKVTGDGELIRCKEGQYETVVFDLPYAVQLEGGYNADFSSNAGSFSTITGYISLAYGSATISNIVIQ